MSRTVVESFADLGATTTYADLPAPVVAEAQRVLLDTIGCIVAGHGQTKGDVGTAFGFLLGGSAAEASVLGGGRRTSVFGAAFANSELASTLDFDAVLAPGHVAPIVIPTALAVAESRGSTGAQLITALAVGQEIACRIGMAMDGLRDVIDGTVTPPDVMGSSSIVFGATAAAVVLEGWPRDVLEHALGIAGCVSPVNYQRSWMAHMPPTTMKYVVGGAVTQAALTAAHLAHLGHTGDPQILDDTRLGYPKFIGTQRWERSVMVDGLGEVWRFPAGQTFKPYPNCRVLHPIAEALREILETDDITPEEIESITVWGEGLALEPVWQIRELGHVSDSQTSVVHAVAVAAQRLPPGPAWQDPGLVFDTRTQELASRVTFRLHPDRIALLQQDPTSRPARVEVIARGRAFTSERNHPYGTPSTVPGTTMSTDDLVTKFYANTSGALSEEAAQRTVDLVLELADVQDVRQITDLVRGGS